MDKRFTKPGFKTYEEQLQHLKNHGLLILDEEKALTDLKNIGYYRLRGYSIQWYDRSKKQFNRSGLTFEEIVMLHNFDRELSSQLLSTIMEIEIALRSYFANEVTYSLGPMAYRDIKNYGDKNKFSENLQHVDDCISRSSDVFIQHNLDKYTEIPIWAMAEVVSFGTLSKLFKSFSADVKKRISIKYYGQKNYHWVANWIHCVSVLRNICAHGGRLYNRQLPVTPVILESLDGNTHSINSKTLYRMLLAMKYLTMKNEDKYYRYTWRTKLCSFLEKETSGRSTIELTCLGFPSDWKEHLFPVY